MTQVIRLNTYQETHIIVQTRRGTDIPNSQFYEFSRIEENQFNYIKRKYPYAKYRTQPSPFFNCHGLVFASRRTGIYEGRAITLCLRDDNYSEIPRTDVLPGDVIIYFGENGDIEHSGLVLSQPDPQFQVPQILSKWGRFCEVIHFVHDCPYNSANIKYYRLNK